MTRSTRCFKTKNVRTKAVFCKNQKGDGKGAKNCRRIVKDYIPCKKGSIKRQLAFMKLRAMEKARKRYRQKNPKKPATPLNALDKNIARIYKKLKRVLTKKDFTPENYPATIRAFYNLTVERSARNGTAAPRGPLGVAPGIPEVD
jgi:hypothetical protein